MEIKFDLSKAKIFIPLGRKGNLKKQIWDNLELSANDFKDFAGSIDTEAELKNVFDAEIAKCTTEAASFIKELSAGTIQTHARAGIESALDAKKTDDLIDIIMFGRSSLEDSLKSVMENPEIEKKLQKLRKIQQFNELKGE